VTISILIVNWNSRELLRRCLESIRTTCRDLGPQVVVVDGGSFDGCGEMIAADFPEVEFVQSQENIGFGRCNNLGFERVNGDMLLLLNPDTEIRPGTVQTLLAEYARLPRGGMLAPRLLNSDLTPQSSVHALPRPVRQALDSEFLRKLLSPVSWWAPPTGFHPSTSVAVEAVAGACMLLPSKLFRRVGGFGPEYFMYAEDMDLCLKIQQAGHIIYYVPDAEILHHSGASSETQGSKFSAVMMREALHTYLTRHRGGFSGFLYRAVTCSSSIVRLLFLYVTLLGTRDQRRLVAKRNISKWRSILSWSIGLERWVKPYFVIEEPKEHICGTVVR
jgi:N-acetylglucosaminyl-diphospho-decaprenol L-rhamnosyltransferase